MIRSGLFSYRRRLAIIVAGKTLVEEVTPLRSLVAIVGQPVQLTYK